MKREFNGKRLYSLLKKVVIAITLLAVLIAVLNYGHLNSDEYVQRTNKCDQEYQNRMSDQIELSLWSSCLTTEHDILKLQQDNFTYASVIAILLPLIFFGGTWVFKYIFPIKNEK